MSLFPRAFLLQKIIMHVLRKNVKKDKAKLALRNRPQNQPSDLLTDHDIIFLINLFQNLFPR